MNDRPVLDRNLDSKTFRYFYHLKEELVDFCRENGLPVSGGNTASERIEIGFENCTNGDHKCETSSIYVISRYLEMIKTEYIEKLAETICDI